MNTIGWIRVGRIFAKVRCTWFICLITWITFFRRNVWIWMIWNSWKGNSRVLLRWLWWRWSITPEPPGSEGGEPSLLNQNSNPDCSILYKYKNSGIFSTKILKFINAGRIINNIGNLSLRNNDINLMWIKPDIISIQLILERLISEQVKCIPF